VPNQQIQDHRWIQIKPSRLALVVSGLGASLAFAIVVFLLPNDAVAIWAKVVLLFALGAAIWLHLRDALLLSSSAITAFYLLELDAKPSLDADFGSGKNTKEETQGMRLSYVKPGGTHEIDATARLQTGAFVTPWFTAVPYSLENDRAWRKFWPRVLPIWRDGIEADAFRRVRVQLKWR
jgi:hypothetical protein